MPLYFQYISNIIYLYLNRDGVPPDVLQSLGVSEELLSTSKCTEGAEIGDVQRHMKLVIGAHRAQRQAAKFEDDAATGAVVAHLGHLVLQESLPEVIAEAERRIPPAAVHLAVAHHDADLIGLGLQNRVRPQGELGQVDGEFAVGPHLQQSVHRGHFAAGWVVLQTELRVVSAA